MKTLLIFLLAFNLVLCISCDDYMVDPVKECYTIGIERCNENKAQWCDGNYWWSTFQDCGSVGLDCYYNDPSHASGLTGIAVCD